MSRCTQHVRRARNPNVRCDICGCILEPGDRYRQQVLIQEDFARSDYERNVAHESCAAPHEWWALFEDPPPCVPPAPADGVDA